MNQWLSLLLIGILRIAEPFLVTVILMALLFGALILIGGKS